MGEVGPGPSKAQKKVKINAQGNIESSLRMSKDPEVRRALQKTMLWVCAVILSEHPAKHGVRNYYCRHVEVTVCTFKPQYYRCLCGLAPMSE